MVHLQRVHTHYKERNLSDGIEINTFMYSRFGTLWIILSKRPVFTLLYQAESCCTLLWKCSQLLMIQTHWHWIWDFSSLNGVEMLFGSRVSGPRTFHCFLCGRTRSAITMLFLLVKKQHCNWIVKCFYWCGVILPHTHTKLDFFFFLLCFFMYWTV